ncbi:FAD-dependent oxidoreductase [Paenibacillus sp. V4I7]|uniref:FAD-dependent oxidoreductase n=1 Tax=Paenibacillus sp. V4I7 TaxID=3042307 RepID=UPI002784D4B2|nr:FAD-dependent oxidoreductase [Paenibacillus sp. V4I7]MDQ0897730.1 hypothetical protein [Paenibacillus sp. V4I7]
MKIVRTTCALLTACLLIAAAASLIFVFQKQPEERIVIYGGGPQAVAAALKAADGFGGQVTMIVPENRLGSIQTAGGQNLFDLNSYKPSRLPEGIPADYKGAQAGSLFYFLRELSPVFPPSQMEQFFSYKTGARKNIRVLYQTDIERVDCESQGSAYRVSSVAVRPLKRAVGGGFSFDFQKPPEIIRGLVFIDASETGRLVRLTGHHIGTVGREDQNPDEKQMAATLMFKAKGIDVEKAVTDWTKEGCTLSEKGSLQLWGGYILNTDPGFSAYNENPASPYRFKPYNAGEDGYSQKGSARSKDMEFWVNGLLIYDVDAQLQSGIPNSKGGTEPSEARRLALEEIAKPEFISMLRRLPGWGSAEIVIENGKPAAGETLYIRESVHTAIKVDKERRIYEFALDKSGVTGGDSRYYKRRIGLGYYQFDSNSYKKGEPLSNPLPAKPWYVPYDVLLCPSLTNVLIPGYAANIDSFAWTAMRVYPNLIVLGDAAGAAAALALRGDFELSNPTQKQIEFLQRELLKYQAILEK